jgi:peroxiredoxin
MSSGRNEQTINRVLASDGSRRANAKPLPAEPADCEHEHRSELNCIRNRLGTKIMKRIRRDKNAAAKRGATSNTKRSAASAGAMRGTTMNMIRSSGFCAVTLAIALGQSAGADDDAAKSTLVKVGEKAPDFTCKTILGEEFALGHQQGNVVLVNFFATWCGPCLAELPHVEKEIAQKYADRKDFRLIVIGREHNTDELAKFAKEKSLNLPMAADPKREIYAKYAGQYIPRNFVIGKDGMVKLASVGYTESSFQEIVQTLEKELGARESH